MQLCNCHGNGNMYARFLGLFYVILLSVHVDAVSLFTKPEYSVIVLGIDSVEECLRIHCMEFIWHPSFEENSKPRGSHVAGTNTGMSNTGPLSQLWLLAKCVHHMAMRASFVPRP